MKRSYGVLSAAVLTWAASAAVSGSADATLEAVLDFQSPPTAVTFQLPLPAGSPATLVSPDGRFLLLLHWRNPPPIAELAHPWLNIGGMSVRPGSHLPGVDTFPLNGFTLFDIARARGTEIGGLPSTPLSYPVWSPTSRAFAFASPQDDGARLWIADVGTKAARQLSNLTLNLASPRYENSYSYAGTELPFVWTPSGGALLCNLTARAAEEQPSDGVQRPEVFDTREAARATVDTELFEQVFASQPAFIDAYSGAATPFARPAVYRLLEISPDERYVLSIRLVEPYMDYFEGTTEVEVLDRRGKQVRLLGARDAGNAGTPRFPRWQTNHPSTLTWVSTRRPAGAELFAAAPPFLKPQRLFSSENTIGFVFWTERGDALVRTQSAHGGTLSWLAASGHARSRQLWSESADEFPATPFMRITRNGQWALTQSANWIYLNRGYGTQANHWRREVTRYNLRTGKSERVFDNGPPTLEQVIAVLEGPRLLTRRESAHTSPEYLLRAMGDSQSIQTVSSGAAREDLLSKERVQLAYRRADGMELRSTLHLPLGFKRGQPLPIIFRVHPPVKNVRSSANIDSAFSIYPAQFFYQYGLHKLFLLRGCGVLEADMPLAAGSAAYPYKNFPEQIRLDAEAAVQALSREGYSDGRRIGVMGVSFGGLTVTNLLVHTDLFAAGFSLSGGYDPMTEMSSGFQAQTLSLWDDPNTYLQLTPYLHVDSIKAPLLMIHGAADTVSPAAAVRLYKALSLRGKTARLVLLPYEGHGFTARESLQRTAEEMLSWADRYVIQD